MIRFYLSKSESENLVIRAAYAGCPEEKELVTLDNYEPSDVAVVMGVYKRRVPLSYPRGEVIRNQHYRGLDCLILETGYINRGSGEDNHYAFGWNGLNGRADFRNRGMPADRAERFRSRLKPWKDAGDYILLCGQVPWDASVDFIEHVEWLKDTRDIFWKASNRNVRFRPHPLAKIDPIEGYEYSTRSLEEDLDGAWCQVSFNSNSGVDAILHGVPCFSFDKGSMVYDISRHDWEVEYPSKPDRQQWLNDLTYCQWTPAEFRSGEAWRHIFRQNSTDK